MSTPESEWTELEKLTADLKKTMLYVEFAYICRQPHQVAQHLRAAVELTRLIEKHAENLVEIEEWGFLALPAGRAAR